MERVNVVGDLKKALKRKDYSAYQLAEKTGHNLSSVRHALNRMHNKEEIARYEAPDPKKGQKDPKGWYFYSLDLAKEEAWEDLADE